MRAAAAFASGRAIRYHSARAGGRRIGPQTSIMSRFSTPNRSSSPRKTGLPEIARQWARAMAAEPEAAAMAIAVPLLAYGFLYGLGSYGILDNNEGLYAEIPREMLHLRDFVIPHLNFLPYIEKPPLLYWLVALSYEIFGVSEFSARLVPALAALGTCGVAYWLGQRDGRRLQGLVAAIVMGSSIAFIAIGRTVFFESLLTLTMSAALACLYLFLRDGNRFHLRAAYVWLALGVMTKGFIALILPALVVFTFLMLHHAPMRRYRPFFTDLPAIAIFLAIVAPWHIAAALREPDFAWFYFINEHFNRFVGTRVPRDYYGGPLWYYLPRLFGYLAPWSVILPAAILSAWREKTPLDSFLLIWLGTFLIFFSLSSNKANYYLATAAVPMALLIAGTIVRWLEEKRLAPLGLIGALWGGAFLCGLVTLKASCAPDAVSFYPVCLAATPWTIGTFLVYLAAIGLIALKRSSNLMAFMIVAGLIGPTLLTVQDAAIDDETALSERSLITPLASLGDRHPLYLAGKFEDVSSVLFYERARIHIVSGVLGDKSSDLAYGERHAEPDWFIGIPDFIATAQNTTLYLVLKQRTAPHFLGRFGDIGLCKIGETKRAILMTNDQNECSSVERR